MSWFTKTKDTVTVEFFENGQTVPFAVSEVPPQQLPDTFEINTELNLKQQDWCVVQALPALKKDFIKTGNLKVVLSKILTIAPKELLFSLPTLNNSLFELEGWSGKNLLFIHEDDWRQNEFVSKKEELNITQERKAIAAIYNNHQVGIGFTKVHLRELIELPLIDSAIHLNELSQFIDVSKKYDGFGVANTEGRAKDSFAFTTIEGAEFYGQTDITGKVIYLCVTDSQISSKSISEIENKYNVALINWCKLNL